MNCHGRCARCQRRHKLSKEAFSGNREQAIIRDGQCCRACGSIEDLLVHHRRPGQDALRLLVTLCRSCHTRIHHTLRPTFGFRDELRRLWREAHPGLPEQQLLALVVAAGCPSHRVYQQVSLFEAA